MASAVAPVACNEGQYGNYIEKGLLAEDYQYYGVSARIEAQNPRLCNGGPQNNEDTTRSASSAWVMIWSHYAPNSMKDGWAQVGYLEGGSQNCYGTAGCANGLLQFFSQYTLPCRSTLAGCQGGPEFKTVLGNTIAPESLNTYAVVPDDDGVGNIWMYLLANGSVIDTVNYEPAVKWPNQAWTPQWAEETRHPQSDIPGHDSPPNVDHADFDTLAWVDGTGQEHGLTVYPTRVHQLCQYGFETSVPTGTGHGTHGIKFWTEPHHGYPVSSPPPAPC